MRILHHVAISPHCRKIRLQLAEKKLPFGLEIERPWERRERFLAISPSGEVPVLRDETGVLLSDTTAIAEYLEEVYPQVPLLPKAPAARAEARRLIAWFDRKFDQDVGARLAQEKIYKRFGWTAGAGTAPDMAQIRFALEAVKGHLDYVGRLADQRGWLAGELSLADLAAAAHLSCVDYLGDVPWEECPPAKEWYARIKSRPCFRPLLADHLAGMTPPPHYANLDF
ncbi:MAG TPA: glutathione S-transferase [Alphaproteobacteria bacterium]|nr:glutathione S-transferase [Alphaproteobacteria bacterium]HAJ45125.1 glutathione S-transferase [Alphaproteobacteria bacterium]